MLDADPMIILYPFDAAYCYDALSILDVKVRSGRATEHQIAAVLETYSRADAILRGQVGFERHYRIKQSEEYDRLVFLNQRLFDEFDWLHTRGVTAPAEEVKMRAIETDRINGVERPAAKRALQERWFRTVPTEVKIGYGGDK